jgi:hypothetical protein
MTDSRQYRRNSGEYGAVVVADWTIWGIRTNEQETGGAELLVCLLGLELFATCSTHGLAIVFFVVGRDQSVFQNLVEVFFDVVVQQLIVIVVFVRLLALGPRCVLRRVIVIVVVVISCVVIIIVELIFVQLSRGIVGCSRIILFVGFVVFSHLVASV